MEKKYKIELNEKRTLKNFSRSDITVTLQNGKADLNIDDVKTVINEFNKEAKKTGDEIKVCVRVLNPHQWFTIKAFDTDLDEDTIDDYYSGEVKSVDKFEQFSQMQVIILRTKN